MYRKFAIVGAGLAGLACARELAQAGHDVVLYETSGSPGGRAATRRTDTASFDHGAQYFVVRDTVFAERIEDLRRTGVVAPWTPRWPQDTRESAPLLVGAPDMSALGRAFAGGLDLRLSSTIVGLARDAHGWRLRDEYDSINEGYAAVALAVPAPQALPLLGAHPALATRVRCVAMSPCWAALVEFETPLDLELDADWRPHPLIPWVARNTSKPRRPEADAWVVHASTEWTVAHLNEQRATVVPELLQALPGRLEAVVGRPVQLPPAIASAGYLWRHARVDTPLGKDCLWDPALALGACGDWCIGARLEAAFVSGRALGLRMLATLGAG